MIIFYIILAILNTDITTMKKNFVNKKHIYIGNILKIFIVIVIIMKQVWNIRISFTVSKLFQSALWVDKNVKKASRND